MHGNVSGNLSCVSGGARCGRATGDIKWEGEGNKGGTAAAELAACPHAQLAMVGGGGGGLAKTPNKGAIGRP